MLTPVSPPFPGAGVGVVNPTAMGTHNFGGGDTYGIVYTCAAGFFDLAHARDLIDLTRYYHHWLTLGGSNKVGGEVPAFGYRGMTRMRTVVPPADVVATASSMAYDESVFHEIESYFAMTPGGHNSAFSPEDLVSNFLGAYVGGRALAAGWSNATVTTELNALLSLLGAQPPTATQAAFNLIVGNGIIATSLGALMNNGYLTRRNFEVAPIQPWPVTGVPGCSSSAWPNSIPRSFGAAITGYYDTAFGTPPHAAPALGAIVRRSAFAASIGRIKAAAERTYGAKYATPWPA
jgi:uncharacterized protein DUF4056